MPDDILESLIAHETAHVYQFAAGKNRFALTENDINWQVQPRLFKNLIGEDGMVELHADQVMLSWGFDPLDVPAWLKQVTEIHAGVVTFRHKPRREKYARELARKEQSRIYHSLLRPNR